MGPWVSSSPTRCPLDIAKDRSSRVADPPPISAATLEPSSKRRTPGRGNENGHGAGDVIGGCRAANDGYVNSAANGNVHFADGSDRLASAEH